MLSERRRITTKVNIFVNDELAGERKDVVDGAVRDGVDVEIDSFACEVVFAGGGERLSGGRDDSAGVGTVGVEFMDLTFDDVSVARDETFVSDGILDGGGADFEFVFVQGDIATIDGGGADFWR